LLEIPQIMSRFFVLSVLDVLADIFLVGSDISRVGPYVSFVVLDVFAVLFQVSAVTPDVASVGPLIRLAVLRQHQLANQQHCAAY